MRGGGFSCFPCSPLRVPYLWASLGSSLVFNKLHLLIKKKKILKLCIDMFLYGYVQFSRRGKEAEKNMDSSSLCLFWTLWRARNRMAFENEVTTAQRIKINFISNLWTWANLYSNANTKSVLDFLTWLGCR